MSKKTLNKKHVLSKKWKIFYAGSIFVGVCSVLTPLSTVAMSSANTISSTSLLASFFDNKQALRDALASKRETLPERAKRSDVYSDFVNLVRNFSLAELLDKATMTRRIENLSLDEELKLYLYENYLEKLDFAKKASAQTSKQSYVNTDDRIMEWADGDGRSGGGGGFGSSVGSADWNYLATGDNSNIVVLDPWEYQFYRGQTYRVLEDWDEQYYPDAVSTPIRKGVRPGWHVNSEGDWTTYDLYYPYGELASELIRNAFRRLYSEDPLQNHTAWLDNGEHANQFKTFNKRLTFKNVVNNEVEHLYFNYNISIGDTTKPTYGVLTIYNDKNLLHMTSANDNTNTRTKYGLVPTVFGIPINLMDINLSKENRSGLHFDNAQTLSTYRSPSAANKTQSLWTGSYNESFLIPEDFINIEKDIAIYVFSKLNGYKVEHVQNSLREDEINSSFLYFPIGENLHSYFIDAAEQRVLKNGITTKEPEISLHAWTADVALIKWSNEDIFMNSYNIIVDFIKKSLNQETSRNINNTVNSALFLTDFASNLLSQNTRFLEFFKITDKFFTGLSRFTGLFSFLFNFKTTVDQIKARSPINSDAGDDQVVEFIVRMALPTIGLISVATAANPLFGLAVAAFAFLLDLIPSGNGHSFFDNFNDAGLNDWDFQMKNNFNTLQRIAVSWSENYHKGVTWKTVDDWFELPELFIKAQDDPEEMYRHLSPGDSFNWGHKIFAWQK